jgi:hypothetical protein
VKTRDQLSKKDMGLLARGAEPASPRLDSAPAIQRSVLQLQRSLGNQAVMQLLGSSNAQHSSETAKPLAINEPGDRFEREADAVADQVMRAPSSQAGGSRNSLSTVDDGSKIQRRCAHCEEEEEKRLHRQIAPVSAGGGIQRKCSQCEEEEEKQLHRKEDGGSNPGIAPGIVHDVLRAPGQPLDSGTRNFMEPRFGHDFSGVRVHNDARAAASTRSVNAQAYTVGNDVVFGSRQYAPESDAGRRLLAHELTHVVQQTAGADGTRLARQPGTGTRSGTTTGGTPQGQPPVAAAPGLTIAPNCAGHEAEITAAWLRATAMLRDTISDLDNVVSAMRLPGGPRRLMPRMTSCILTSFGDVGGLDGAEAGESIFTLLSTVIQNFQRIQSGFVAGRTLRCDPQTVPDNECTWRSAFVVTGNARDIFLCQNFFSPENSVAIRAATLIHEMAHSVLGIAHRGIPEMTFPATFFDYSSPLGLDFDDAKRNAFAYEILANCLEGEPPTPLGSGSTAPAPPRTAGNEPRASVSLMGGATVTPAIQGLAGVAGRLSLRPGSLVIFNPYLGLNVLYSPTATIQPAGFFTGMAEAGLRIQQPTRGAYLDIGGGGFVGFEAPLRAPLRTTAGLSAAVGAGWRWDRIELGAEARALFPLTSGDPDRVVVLGRFAVRFGQ